MEAWLEAYLVESEVYSRIMRHDVDYSTGTDPNPVPLSVRSGFITNLQVAHREGPVKSTFVGSNILSASPRSCTCFIAFDNWMI